MVYSGPSFSLQTTSTAMRSSHITEGTQISLPNSPVYVLSGADRLPPCRRSPLSSGRRSPYNRVRPVRGERVGGRRAIFGRIRCYRSETIISRFLPLPPSRLHFLRPVRRMRPDVPGAPVCGRLNSGLLPAAPTNAECLH
jgi:hypothetical protein